MLAWLTTVMTALTILQFAPAFCQPPPRGRSGPSPFLDAEILQLLHDELVRDEIGLEEEEFAIVRDKMRAEMKSVWELAAKLRQEGKSRDQIHDEIREQFLPIEKAIFEMLKEKADLERLIGLYAQQRNYSAATSDHIAKRIGLEGDELKQFRKEHSDLRRQSMQETYWEIKRKLQNPNAGQARQQVGALIKKAREKVDAALGEKLSADHKEKLETLKGEPFDDLPERGPGPPHRRRGFGGKGGPGKGEPDKKGGREKERRLQRDVREPERF